MRDIVHDIEGIGKITDKTILECVGETRYYTKGGRYEVSYDASSDDLIIIDDEGDIADVGFISFLPFRILYSPLSEPSYHNTYSYKYFTYFYEVTDFLNSDVFVGHEVVTLAYNPKEYGYELFYKDVRNTIEVAENEIQ